MFGVEGRGAVREFFCFVDCYIACDRYAQCSNFNETVRALSVNFE